MGTKEAPGAFDCYDKAEPGEPVFTLLARDPIAPALIDAWAAAAEARGEPAEKVAEARRCAWLFRDWRKTNRKPGDSK